MAQPQRVMSPEEKAAKTAAFMSALAAVGAGIAAFKKAPVAQAGQFPPEVLQLLQTIADGIGITIADLEEILAALGTLAPGGFRGWPENCDSAQVVVINCQVAMQTYQAPDFVVPDGFNVAIKAHPLNAVGSLVYCSTQPAANIGMAWPLIPNEPLTFSLKRTGGIFVFSNIAGSQAVIALEQRAGGGG